MSFDIRITRAAERDLMSAVDHIEHVLFDPAAADELLSETERVVSALAEFPEMYALADDPVLKSWGVRIAPVKKYIAFYTIDEDERCVKIIRFLYGKRDWNSILRQ